MTPEQILALSGRELDRAVAKVLGCSFFTIDAPAGWYCHAPGEKTLSPMPCYSTNPTDADIVRLEIERRDWEWGMGRYGDKRPFAFISIGEGEENEYPAKGDTWQEALCRAYLLTHHATNLSSTANSDPVLEP